MMAEEKPDLRSVDAKPLYSAATPVFGFDGSGWVGWDGMGSTACRWGLRNECAGSHPQTFVPHDADEAGAGVREAGDVPVGLLVGRDEHLPRSMGVDV